MVFGNYTMTHNYTISVYFLVQRCRPISPLQCKMMKVEHEGQFFRCHVRNLATKVHQARWHAYLEKEGQLVEVGAYSRVTAEMKAKDLVDLANSHGIKAALEHYVETGGALEKVANISR